MLQQTISVQNSHILDGNNRTSNSQPSMPFIPVSQVVLPVVATTVPFSNTETLDTPLAAGGHLSINTVNHLTIAGTEDSSIANQPSQARTRVTRQDTVNITRYRNDTITYSASTLYSGEIEDIWFEVPPRWGTDLRFNVLSGSGRCEYTSQTRRRVECRGDVNRIRFNYTISQNVGGQGSNISFFVGGTHEVPMNYTLQLQFPRSFQYVRASPRPNTVQRARLTWRDTSTRRIYPEVTLRIATTPPAPTATSRPPVPPTPTSTPQSGCQTIRYGQTIDGRVATEGGFVDYCFNAIDTDQIEIRLDAIGSFDPYVQLYDPQGRRIGFNNDGGLGQNAFLRESLSINGRYRIRVRGNLVSTGRYSLSLVGLREPTPVPRRCLTIRYGETKSGTIVNPRDFRDYCFQGTAGQRVQIRMDGRGSFNPYVELYHGGRRIAENGDGGRGWLNSILRLRLQSDGRYLIRARGFQDSTGSYTLTIRELSTNDTNAANVSTQADIDRENHSFIVSGPSIYMPLLLQGER